MRWISGEPSERGFAPHFTVSEGTSKPPDQWPIMMAHVKRRPPPSMDEIWEQVLDLPEAVVGTVYEHTVSSTDRQVPIFGSLFRRGFGVVVLVSPILIIATVLRNADLSDAVMALLSVAGAFAFLAVLSVLCLVKAGEWRSTRQPYNLIQEVPKDADEMYMQRRLIAQATFAYEVNKRRSAMMGCWLNSAIACTALEFFVLLAAVLLNAVGC